MSLFEQYGSGACLAVAACLPSACRGWGAEEQPDERQDQACAGRSKAESTVWLRKRVVLDDTGCQRSGAEVLVEAATERGALGAALQGTRARGPSPSPMMRPLAVCLELAVRVLSFMLDDSVVVTGALGCTLSSRSTGFNGRGAETRAASAWWL